MADTRINKFLESVWNTWSKAVLHDILETRQETRVELARQLGVQPGSLSKYVNDGKLSREALIQLLLVFDLNVGDLPPLPSRQTLVTVCFSDTIERVHKLLTGATMKVSSKDLSSLNRLHRANFMHAENDVRRRIAARLASSEVEAEELHRLGATLAESYLRVWDWMPARVRNLVS